MGWVVYGVSWVVWGVGSLLRRWRSGPAWIHIVVEGPLPAFDPPREPLWRRFLMPRGGPSLRQVGARFRRLAGDDRVQGVVLHLRPVPMASADAAALAGLVSEARGAGKRIVCWATGYTAGTYQVACAADEVLLQPGGVIGPLGLARTYLFLKEALTRLGVEADVIQVSPYKTAGDLLGRRTLTPQAREMADWLADSEIEERVATIAAGRRLDAAQAQALLDESPFTDTRALELRAIDAICSEEDLPERLGSEPVPWESARRRLRRPRPIPPGRCVGLLRIEGAIIDGQSQHPPVSPPIPLPLLLQEQAGDLTVVQQARRLARTRRVAAVVLWIDSPGGSATASEAMAAALQALADRKPLVAVMGAVAGSGGYYVATPARRIFAQPGTLTGSIGVITTRVAIGGLLRRLLIGHQVISRGTYSGMEDSSRPTATPSARRFARSWTASTASSWTASRKAAGAPSARSSRSPAGGSGRPAGSRPRAGRRARRGRPGARRGAPPGWGADDAPLIELGGRGAVAPAATGTAALVLGTVRALTLAPAWLMCPLLDADLIGLPGA